MEEHRHGQPEACAVPSSAQEQQRAAIVARVRRLAEHQVRQAPEWVVERVAMQAAHLLTLRQQLQEQQQEIERLEERLAAVERAGKRQAAPFRRDPSCRKAERTRPGRKPGHPGAWRTCPSDEEVSERIEVQLKECPHCGDELAGSEGRAIEQTIVEVPVVQPRVVRLRTYRYCCESCQQWVSSKHPLQVSGATGAAGTHLGPRALGIATLLHERLGLPVRKTVQVLQELLGLQVSPGGLSQAFARVAQRLQPEYEQLLDRLQHSEVLYSDETSWWVDGPGYVLWVLTNAQGTYYRVVSSRSKDMARQLIGEDFDGVLVSDCLSIYDDLNPVQQKCYAHHLKALSQALDTPAAHGSLYLLELRALLHTALLLKQLQPHLSRKRLSELRQAVEQRMDTLLAHPRGDPDTPPDLQSQQEEKVRRRLAKQQDHLFTFLDYEGVEATNNRAERQLRPAVIRRKVSTGNKTHTGARTWQILASLAETAAQTEQSFIDQVAQAMSLAPDA